jgi:hypothetical protein
MGFIYFLMGVIGFFKGRKENKPNYSKSIIRVTARARAHTIKHAGKQAVM